MIVVTIGSHCNHFTNTCQYVYNITMPKKTRKEKILAQQRKKYLHTPHNYEPVREKAPPPLPLNKNNVNIPNEADILLQTYFLKDLKKSLSLISIIITLEIVIYFGTINNYLSLIFNFK